MTPCSQSEEPNPDCCGRELSVACPGDVPIDLGDQVTVFLVGAGPGDPELLTVKAARILALADVVLHDRLVPEEILALAPPAAERIDVGKRPGGSHVQGVINDLLVTLGQSGRTIVRLKGGDPYLFGRGGEEVDALAAAGVRLRGGAGCELGHRRTRRRRGAGHAPDRRQGGHDRHRSRSSHERARRLGAPGESAERSW